ncbi:MAG: hypothetical protein K2Y27_27665 [Xanthobacteraceae bacterium]|nr:hypothetical protein [Xanthobacteraceae bacterium]
MKALHRSFRFADGRLVKCEPPDWFARATAADVSWNVLLKQAGATAIEDFGEHGDTLDIHEGRDGDCFIGYWDSNKCIANIFIDNIADYLLFRATYIAPLARLTMESDRHYEWQKGNKAKAAR